jgi:hypothetical protein
MFLLVVGASGVGTSTVRRLVAGDVARTVDAADFAELAGPPEPTPRWRHEAVERVVRLALGAPRRRHFLLCGDVAPDEIVAAPSADRLRGLAVCLLDASEDAQRRRLFGRSEDPALVARHVARAAWLRAHVTAGETRTRPWSTHVIDTSELRDYEVATRVAAWIRRVTSVRARLRVARR